MQCVAVPAVDGWNGEMDIYHLEFSSFSLLRTPYICTYLQYIQSTCIYSTGRSLQSFQTDPIFRIYDS